MDDAAGLTKEDVRNGWTEESLARYRMERDMAASERMDPSNRQQRPARQNNRYSKLRWRR